MEIKAALPKEFSRETEDANRWLMAMEAHFTLHKDKYPNSARTVVFLNRIEKPLSKLGSPSLKTNALLMQTRPGPRSRKPSRPHSPPMTQQRKPKLPLLYSTKTRRTPQNLTNISSLSSSSLSILESPTTMPCWSGFSKDSTHKLWYNSLSWEQSKTSPLWKNFTQRLPKSKEVTATLHHSGEDPNHPMEEVVVTMIPMLWTWIASRSPWSSELTTCMKIAVSYAIKKAVLLRTILVTIGITQQVVGTTTQNYPRPPTQELSPPLPIRPLPSVKMTSWISFSRTSPKLKDVIRYCVS